jgi:polyketide synthase 12/myxalamid-type polyketide synthase MxaB
MRQGRPQVAVIPVDWPVFLGQFARGSRPRWLSEVAADRARVSARPTAGGPAASARRERLREASPDQRIALLRDLVRDEVATVLGLHSADAIDERQPLHEMGLDSLMAVELRNLLSVSVATELSATLAFDHPTVEALAAHLAGVLFDAPSPAERVDAARGAALEVTDDLLASIEMMSDADVAKLIGE